MTALEFSFGDDRILSEKSNFVLSFVAIVPAKNSFYFWIADYLFLSNQSQNKPITMRRLLSLIKKITPFTAEEENAFSSILRKKILLPRERLGEDIPPASWIFVEEGFLLLLQRQKGLWTCSNFYYEGVSTVLYNVGSAELAEKSCNVQAVEESVIYYLTAEDEEAIVGVFPGFFYARRILNIRSYMQHQKRAGLFTLDHELDRIIYVTKLFTILLRAPEKHLADFLCVKNKMGREILSNIYKKERVSKIMNKGRPG